MVLRSPKYCYLDSSNKSLSKPVVTKGYQDVACLQQALTSVQADRSIKPKPLNGETMYFKTVNESYSAHHKTKQASNYLPVPLLSWEWIATARMLSLCQNWKQRKAPTTQLVSVWTSNSARHHQITAHSKHWTCSYHHCPVSLLWNCIAFCISHTNRESHCLHCVLTLKRTALWDFCPCGTQNPAGFRLRRVEVIDLCHAVAILSQEI